LEANQKGFAPHDTFEWLPFIEADARTGAWGSAEALAHQSLRDDPKFSADYAWYLKGRGENCDFPYIKSIQKFNCGQ